MRYPSRTVMSLHRWTDDEMRAFAAMCRRAGVEPAYALAVYSSESGLNPHAVNPGGGAQGLAQIMPQFLRAFGWEGNPREFHLQDVMGQLPVIENLLKSQVRIYGGPPESASKLYHLNLYPKTAHQNIVLTEQGDPAAYNGNKVFDPAHKGFIDEVDLAVVLGHITSSKTFEDILSQLASVDPGPSVSGECT